MPARTRERTLAHDTPAPVSIGPAGDVKAGAAGRFRFGAAELAGYGWSPAGIAAATGCFWLLRDYLDKGQASLLYLPVVIACAARFGFGPAVLAALLSFLCWNFFFLPPYYTLIIHDPKDWLSLFVFLVAAVTTGQLAARLRDEARLAQAREAEVATLFDASETLSRELSAARLLEALSRQVQTLCQATRCIVFHGGNGASPGPLLYPAGAEIAGLPEERLQELRNLAILASEHDQVIGFGLDRRLWDKALAAASGILAPVRKPLTAAVGNVTHPDAGLGVFVPLHAAGATAGVLHVGPRRDGQPFSPVEQRLILTLANHAATAIAREELAEQAAQATALREADILKDALLSLVSHELRTPLAAIKASATGLLQREARWNEASRVEALAAIDQEADRLTGLVNNLLDLSRLEAGAWTPAKDWCDLADILATVLDRLPEATAARVEAETDAELPLVRADFTQIALVLENLIGNAAKYAPLGPIRVRTETEAENGRIAVSVRDFGPGIAHGEEAKLFSRFFRGSLHRGGPVHGTGLGLALCEAIVRAHGGTIQARNAANTDVLALGEPGAIFSFRLPVELD